MEPESQKSISSSQSSSTQRLKLLINFEQVSQSTQPTQAESFDEVEKYEESQQQSLMNERKLKQRISRARRYYNLKEYLKAYELFKLALELSIYCSGKEPNELTAIIYNQMGVVLCKMKRFQEAIQSIGKSLQEARNHLRILGKETYEWRFYSSAMQNLIYALRCNRQTQSANKLQKYLKEEFPNFIQSARNKQDKGITHQYQKADYRSVTQKNSLNQLDIIKNSAIPHYIFMMNEKGSDISTTQQLFSSDSNQSSGSIATYLDRLQQEYKQVKSLYFDHKDKSKSLEQFEQLLEKINKHYKGRPNQISAVLLNQIGIILFNSQRFQEAFQKFDQSLQMAKAAISENQLQIQQWRYWPIVWYNLIEGLICTGQQQCAAKFQNCLNEIIQRNIEGSIVRRQHITALFSTKPQKQIKYSAFSYHSNKGQLIPLNEQQGKIVANTLHIQQVSRKHSNISHQIITSSSIQGEQLISKKSILYKIQQSFKSNNKRHRFFYCGSSDENGSFIVQTTEHPDGQLIRLEQIFDLFMNLEETKNAKQMKFCLSCSYAGRAALKLKQQRSNIQPSYVGERNIQIFCQTGQNNKNLDFSICGDLLVCKYWSAKIPNALQDQEIDLISKQFKKLNPCVMALKEKKSQFGNTMQWTALDPVNWDTIERYEKSQEEAQQKQIPL